MTIQFHLYGPSHADDCMALFDRNCPAFFAIEERRYYRDFLAAHNSPYYLGMDRGVLVCAFGYGAATDDTPTLNWIMVEPEYHRGGLGGMMMTKYIAYLKAHHKNYGAIATSQHAEPFFERYGATRIGYVQDGWGAGMHRIDMLLPVPT